MAMSGLKKCPRCGARLSGWETYCPRCGARLAAAEMSALSKAWCFISSPDIAVEQILPREGWRSALRPLALLALFPAVGAALLALFTVIFLAPALPALGADTARLGLFLAIAASASAWLGSIAVVAVGAALVFVLLGLLGRGGAPGFSETFAAVTYSESPALLMGPLLAIPFFGGIMVFAASLYGLRILYKALRRGFGAGVGASALCVVVLLILHLAVAWLMTVEAPTLSALLALGR